MPCTLFPEYLRSKRHGLPANLSYLVGSMAGGSRVLRIAVEGCCHGELDQIYASITRMEEATGKKLDLLICCGDFQAVRNKADLRCMAVPQKYLTMASFHKYYSGEAVAPVLTIFIGGNHEAANHLHELFYGGWVAPNIYYMGAAGVVNLGGVRIAGLTGIYKSNDYKKGHYEAPPYNNQTIRSAYHVREYEVFKLAQMREPIDIFISHDWPRDIHSHGDEERLLRTKPFFREECQTKTLGSVPGEFLLKQLQPAFWFAGHLHVKFAAVVRHPAPSQRVTRFLALDKCLPNRDFLQLVEVPRPDSSTEDSPVLEFNAEWLAITRSTHELLSRSDRNVAMPTEIKLPTEEDREWVRRRLRERAASVSTPLWTPYEIPASDFARTAPVHKSPQESDRAPSLLGNPQTDSVLSLLNLGHRVTVPYMDFHKNSQASASGGGEAGGDLFFIDRGSASVASDDPNAIDLDDEGDDAPGSDGDEDGAGSGAVRGQDEAGDTIVLEPQPQPAPPAPMRKKLSLPPPKLDA